LDELGERRLEAEPTEVEACGLAALGIHRHCLGHSLRDVASHPLLERTLPGKHECHLRHRCRLTSSVHSISADPHVRPAPIPVINTSPPGASLPSAAASANASGIDPDDVLPYRSTSITTFSGGMPSLLTA